MSIYSILIPPDKEGLGEFQLSFLGPFRWAENTRSVGEARKGAIFQQYGYSYDEKKSIVHQNAVISAVQ